MMLPNLATQIIEVLPDGLGVYSCPDCLDWFDMVAIGEDGTDAEACEFCQDRDEGPDPWPSWSGGDEDYPIDGVGFADPGGNSALRAATPDNPRCLPCPTCDEPDQLTLIDRQRGYQCNRCADALERGFDLY